MYLIAEIGINHNGDLDLAKQMIREANRCGADAVKFQKRDINTVYTQEFLDSPRDSPWGKTQRAQKEGLEFGIAEYRLIDTYCKKIGIDWFGSAWDHNSLELLEVFDPPFHKVASAMITNIPFLEAVARLGRRVILSTGMCGMSIIHQAVDILQDCDPIIMHCVSVYPCPDEDCNVRFVKTLRNEFPGNQIGYSGHEVGIIPSVVAAGFGATYIERHFTLNRASYGSDQSASLEPKGLSKLREYLDQARECLGDGLKHYDDAERACAGKLRYWE